MYKPESDTRTSVMTRTPLRSSTARSRGKTPPSLRHCSCTGVVEMRDLPEQCSLMVLPTSTIPMVGVLMLTSMVGGGLVVVCGGGTGLGSKM